MIKEKLKGYYDIKNLKSTGAQWNISMGGRDTGKSFALKKELIESAFKSENGRFLYLRRYQDDIDTTSVIGYFSDIINNKDGNNYLSKWTKGMYNNVKAAKRNIWFIKIETVEKTQKDGTVIYEETETDRMLAGYYGAVSKATSYKSLEKPDVLNYVLEEFIPDGQPLLKNEPHLLESIVSSGARSRKDIKVWLIGNNVDRDFYYFRYWNLNKIKKQKVNTIDIYEFENGEYDENGEPVFVKFAVEIVPERNEKGIFFGRGARVNGSNWRTKSQPYMHQSDLEKYDEIYTVFFERHELKWKGRLFTDNEKGEIFWYIEPFSKNVDFESRLISDIVDTSPYHTINLQPLNKFEIVGFDKLKNGKCFFATALCGTEFKRAMADFLISDITKDINEL